MFVLVPLTAVAASPVTFPSIDPFGRPAFAPGSVVVGFVKGSDHRAIARSQGLALGSAFNELGIHELKVPPGVAIAEVISRLSNLPQVRFAEPNFHIYPNYVPESFPNDPLYQDETLWNINIIGSDRAWNDSCPEMATLSKGKPGTAVAVLDTGLRRTHQDMVGDLWENAPEVAGLPGVDDDGNGFIDDLWGWNFVFDTNDFSDNDGHGTAVSGIVGASTNNGIDIASVYPEGVILTGKVMAGGSGTTVDAMEGVVYSALMGIKVVNMSFGMYFQSAGLKAVIDDGHDNYGMTFLAASGNDASNLVFYPSGWANVISVGSTNIDDEVSFFSNFGKVDIAAPGGGATNITLLGSSSDTAIWVANGTSFASPHAAGLAGILSSWGITNLDIRARLEATSVDVNAGSYPGFDQYLGHGRIDTYRAVGTLIYPASFSVSLGGGGIQASWATPCISTFGVDHYVVKRALSPSGPFITIFTSPDATTFSYEDASAGDGNNYCYVVSAVDNQGFETLNTTALCGAFGTTTQTSTHTLSGTITPTPTISATFTHSTSVTPTFTDSATPTVSSTATESTTETPLPWMPGCYHEIWSSYPVDGATQSIAWGDLDGDGDLDQVVANEWEKNRIYTNQWVGAYQTSWSSTETSGSYDVKLGDYDGDGDLDLLIGNAWEENQVYKNDGVGGFSLVWSSTETAATYSVDWGDYDNDGDLDQLVGNYGEANQIYRNDGSDTFTLIWSSTETLNTTEVEWGDYNNDGDLDQLVGNYGDVNQVYRNDGSNVFVLVWSSAEFDLTNTVQWGNYDGDADLDQLVGNASGPNRVYRNDGGGTFTLVWSSTESDWTEDVDWGDFDGDGDLDQLIGNGWDPNRIYQNIGGDAFNLVWSSPESNGTYGIRWGDVNGDGNLDQLVGNYYEENKVYISDPNCVATVTPTLTVTPTPGCLPSTITQTPTPTVIGGNLLELTKIVDRSWATIGDTVTFDLIYKNGQPVPKADIVWIIDGSCSMSDDQTSLATNASSFTTSLGNFDYRLAVVRMGSAPSGFSDPSTPMNQDGTDGARFQGMGHWTTEGSVFSNMVQSVGLSGWEDGFYGLTESLCHYVWRPGAKKVFVIVSDDVDYTTQQEVGCGADNGCTAPHYLSTLAKMLGEEALVYTIVEYPNAQGCPSGHYWDTCGIAQMTGGTFADINDPSWATTLSTIGNDIAINLSTPNVSLIDTLPAELSFVSANPTPSGTGPLTWDLGTLLGGEGGTITIVGQITDFGDFLVENQGKLQSGSSSSVTSDSIPVTIITWTPTITASNTKTYTFTSTHTPTFTDTPTSTPTATPTHTETHTSTFSVTPTWTMTSTLTYTPTFSPTSSPTSTWTLSSTPSITKTVTSTSTSTPTATPTSTPFTTLILDIFDLSGEKVYSVALFQPGLESSLPDELDITWVFDETTKPMIQLIPGVESMWDGVIGGRNMIPAGLYHVVIRSSNPVAGSDEMARFNVSVVVVKSREQIEIVDSDGNIVQTLSVMPSSGGALTLSSEVLVLARNGANVGINVGGHSLLDLSGASLVWDGTNSQGETVPPGSYTVRYVRILPDGTEEVEETTIIVQTNLFGDGEGIVLVPNPAVASDKITVYINIVGGTSGKAKLYTLDGSLIHSLEFDPALGWVEIDIRGLSGGFYLIAIRLEGPDLKRPQVVIKRLAIIR